MLPVEGILNKFKNKPLELRKQFERSKPLIDYEKEFDLLKKDERRD